MAAKPTLGAGLASFFKDALHVAPAAQHGHDSDRLSVWLVHDEEGIEADKKDGTLGQVPAGVPHSGHPTQRRKQFTKLTIDAICEFHAVKCDAGPDLKQVILSLVGNSIERLY